jgi:hypothetical protein
MTTDLMQIPEDPAPLMHMIERAARDPSFPIDRLQQLMALYDARGAKEAEKAWNIAMAAAQAEMIPVAKDSDNLQTRSRYASYAALDAAVRPIYSKHGFALSFNTVPDANVNSIRIVCDVVNGGFCRRYSINMPADGVGAKGSAVMTRTHAAGSAVTYGMRYLLKMIFNIAVGEGDDDGNAAGRRMPPPRYGANPMRSPPAYRDDDDDSQPPGDDAPPSTSHSTEGGAASPAEDSMRIARLDAELGEAAKRGMVELQAAWRKIPASDQRILEAAKNKRHKPTAIKADNQEGNGDGSPKTSSKGSD